MLSFSTPQLTPKEWKLRDISIKIGLEKQKLNLTLLNTNINTLVFESLKNLLNTLRIELSIADSVIAEWSRFLAQFNYTPLTQQEFLNATNEFGQFIINHFNSVMKFTNTISKEIDYINIKNDITNKLKYIKEKFNIEILNTDIKNKDIEYLNSFLNIINSEIIKVNEYTSVYIDFLQNFNYTPLTLSEFNNEKQNFDFWFGEYKEKIANLKNNVLAEMEKIKSEIDLLLKEKIKQENIKATLIKIALASLFIL